jgi:hypothetical protein
MTLLKMIKTLKKCITPETTHLNVYLILREVDDIYVDSVPGLPVLLGELPGMSVIYRG